MVFHDHGGHMSMVTWDTLLSHGIWMISLGMGPQGRSKLVISEYHAVAGFPLVFPVVHWTSKC